MAFMKRISLILFFLFSFTQNTFSAGKIIDTRLTDNQTCEAIYQEINFANSVIEKNTLIGTVRVDSLNVNDQSLEFNADVLYRISFELPGMSQLIKKYENNEIIKNRRNADQDLNYAICEYYLQRAFNEKRIPNFEIGFLNTKNETFKHRKLFLYADGAFRYEYKSNVTIEKEFNFKKFPFEKATLYLILYSTIDNYIKIVPSEYSDTLIEDKMFLKIPGWDITSIDIYAGSDLESEELERFENDLITEINIKRTYVSYLIKFFVPILFIVIIAYSGFWIEERDLKTRVELSIVCLLSLIAFNFVISDKLPDLPYMTFLDTFVLISYFFAGLTTVISIIIYRVPHIPRPGRRNISLNDEFKVWMPSAYLLSNIAAWAFLWNKL
jgi:hypothetical protein